MSGLLENEEIDSSEDR